MDAESLKLLLQGINMIGTGAIWVYLRIEKRNDKTNERIEFLSSHIEQINRDVARIESQAAGAPSHSDLGKVYESINELAATVNQLVGENRGQSDSLRMILSKMSGV